MTVTLLPRWFIITQSDFSSQPWNILICTPDLAISTHWHNNVCSNLYTDSYTSLYTVHGIVTKPASAERWQLTDTRAVQKAVLCTQTSLHKDCATSTSSHTHCLTEKQDAHGLNTVLVCCHCITYKNHRLPHCVKTKSQATVSLC